MIAWMIGIVKDMMTIAGAGTAIYVALRGLTAWRRQLRGNTEFDVARRTLHATYRLREAVNGVRAPFVAVEEMVQGMKEAGLSDEDIASEKNFDKMSGFAYSLRWRSVSDAVVDLDVLCLEAEAIWGKEIPGRIAALLECVKVLRIDIQMYLEEKLYQGPRHDLNEFKQRMNGYRKTIFASSNSDEFSIRLQNSIEVIEKCVKPHLNS